MTEASIKGWVSRLTGGLVLAAVLVSTPAVADPIFEPAFGSVTVRDMLSERRYAAVRDLARRELQDDPENGDTHAVLAYALAGLGEWEQAEQSVLAAIGLVTDERRDDLRVLQAEILLGLGDAPEAERQLREVLERDPDKISALLEMGVLYRRMGDGVRSTEYFERVLVVEPGEEVAIKALFETYVARGDYESIDKLSRRIPDDSPAKALAYYFDALADVRRDPPDYEAAASKLEQALLRVGPSPGMLSTLGWVRFRQQNLDAAADALIQAVELAPDDFESQRLLGAVLLQANRPNLAVGHLQQALAIRETAELRRLLARAYLLLGRNEAMAEQMLAVAEGDAENRQSALTGLYTYVGGDFEQSEAALRSALSERPQASHLRFLLISSLLKQERYEAAEREARQAVRAYPDQKVLALNFVALARLGTGAYDDAEAALNEALALDPGARTTRVNLSTVYFRTGRYGKAEQELDAILANEPGDPRIRVRKARVLQAAGDYSRAEQALLGPSGELPTSKALLRELFLLKIREGDSQAALGYANGIVEAHPTLFEGYLLQAQALAALGRAMEAGEAIDRGFETTGETQGALAAAASLARVNGWHRKAVDYLGRLDAQYGLDDPVLVKLYAVELIEVGNTDKARQVLDAGLGATEPDALFLTARSYIADRDQASAEEYIDAALAAGIAPSVIEQQRAELGTALRLDELREELEDDDDDALRYRTLADAFEFVGDYDAAIDVYESGIGKAGADELFKVQIARLKMRKGDTDAAIDASTALLDEDGISDDSRFTAWFVIGMSRSMRGEPERAERALEEATKPGSKIAPAYYRLAAIKSDNGETDEAIRLLEAAIALEPTTLRHYLALAGAWQRAGDLRSSIAAYERGLAAIENSVPLLNDLALTYVAAGDTAKALETASLALEHAPRDARVLDTMGQVYLRRREPQAAIPYLERAVDGAPQSSLYRFHLGVSYFEAGSADRARAELEESLARQSDSPWAGEIRKVLRAIGES